MASLGVALVITPALCMILLPKAIQQSSDPWMTCMIRAAYGFILPGILRRPYLVYASLLIMGIGAAFGYLQLKEEFLPTFQETDFLMHWVAKPGTNINILREDIRKVGREMLDETAVKEFGSHIARAEVGEEVYGPNFSELWVSLGDFKGDYPAAKRKIEAVMARHPGFEHDLLTYLQERIKEVLSGTGASVVLRIYGPELDVLRQRAAEVRDLIAVGPKSEGMVVGVADLKVETQVLVPQINLAFDPYEMAKYGMTPKKIGDALTTWINGTTVGEIHQDQKKFDVVVRGDADISKRLHDLKRLDIDLPTGKGTVPLAAIADLQIISAPNHIRRDKASRCIDVTCNVKNRDLGSVVHDIEARLKSLPDRPEYRVELLGEYKARKESQTQLLFSSFWSILGIAVLLFIDFRSLRLTFMVLFTLPFALIGGVAAALMHRRRSLARVARRLHHRPRHRGAQRHHAGQPLPPSST